MTERSEMPTGVTAPESLVEIRRLYDQMAQTEHSLVSLVSRLEQVMNQIVTPHPPPPPPWREILTRLEVVIEGCVATSLRARHDLQTINQRIAVESARK